jgi:hypothetical protein
LYEQGKRELEQNGTDKQRYRIGRERKEKINRYTG